MKERLQERVWQLKMQAADANTLEERAALLAEARRIQAIVDSMS